jgi:signal transduction histidine kinase
MLPGPFNMQTFVRPDRVASSNRELIALLLASLSFVCILTLSIVSRGPQNITQLQVRHLVLLGLVIGASIAAFGLVWVTTRRALQTIDVAKSEAARLRQSLILAEAIIKTEPQVVVCWEAGQELKVVTHTLTSVVGVPNSHRNLLRFGSWLDAESAEALRAALDPLFQTAQPFSLLLKTSAGAFLEADGRAAGTHAVLRLRDVATYKSDLVRMLDEKSKLTEELTAGRALLDAIPMPVWLRSRDGRIAWANAAYIAAVEAKSLADVGERQLELLEQSQRKMVAAALAKGTRFSRRLPLIINGERRAHDVIVTSTEQLICSIAVDVAALEKAEGEIDRQMSTYDRTLDRIRTGAAVFDRDQRLTFYNEAFRKLWRLDQDWLDGKPSMGEILDRLHGLSRLPANPDYRGWRAGVLDCQTSGNGYDDWWPLPDGRQLHVVGEQRHDGGVTYLFDDATERLALEGRYNALIDVQRETLDSLKEGVAVFSPDGRLALSNSAFGAIWRLSRDRLEQGPHIGELVETAKVLYSDAKIWDRLVRTVTTVTDEREPLTGQMMRLDQSVVDFATTPLPDGATLVTFADVTASKRYERALEERNEALIAADKLKSQFISHVSYELRTPLTNIIGFSELLASPISGELLPKQREYLSDIQSSSTTLLSIIDDILDLATIDAGTLDLKVSPVKVDDIIDAAILGVRERAMRQRLTIDIATEEDGMEFFADEDRVRQVLYNLLSNAVGFSNSGGLVRLSVWREQGMVAFAVEDDGIGIPKEQQSRVFERFESRSQSGKHRGAGLGLSVVKSLVELHCGDMRLESEPGAGTRVTVRFPERPRGESASPASEALAASARRLGA